MAVPLVSPSCLARIFTASLLFALAQASNDDQLSTNSTIKYVGWQDGPDNRGTMNLIWSCLITIIACTWTVLHLNVPSPWDDTRTKVFRKTKWMVISVIFPEFIFAKAICELQAAVEDLYALSLKKTITNIEYCWGCRLVYRFYHPWETPRAVDDAFLLLKRELNPILPEHGWTRWGGPDDPWESGGVLTLTHCYLANMGGLVSSKDDKLLRLCQLIKVNPNVGGSQSLKWFGISKHMIEDKSKADWLVKAVAILQISWLLVSILTRTAYGLPISQLEICTMAFAALAIFTYAANWAKPKDIEIPFIVTIPDDHESEMITRSMGIEGDNHIPQASFTKRLLWPGQLPNKSSDWRISNDTVRLQLVGTQFLTLSIALAISTALFGAIHCAAWHSDYPTHSERILWLIASVMSMVLPTINLIATGLIYKSLDQEAHRIRRLLKIEEQKYRYCKQDVPEGTRVLFWRGDVLWSNREDHLDERCVNEMITLNKDVSFLQEHLKRRTFDLNTIWMKVVDVRNALKNPLYGNPYMLIQPLADTKLYFNMTSVDQGNDAGSTISVVKPLLEKEKLDDIYALLVYSREAMDALSDSWHQHGLKAERLSRIYTIFTGVLYAIVRIILLVLAFTTLRKQDERLYLDTWARFLPNFG